MNDQDNIICRQGNGVKRLQAPDPLDPSGVRVEKEAVIVAGAIDHWKAMRLRETDDLNRSWETREAPSRISMTMLSRDPE